MESRDAHKTKFHYFIENVVQLNVIENIPGYRKYQCDQPNGYLHIFKVVQNSIVGCFHYTFYNLFSHYSVHIWNFIYYFTSYTQHRMITLVLY